MYSVADRGGHRQVVVGGGHLHNDYLFSGMRQKTARQRSNREHRKLISMWFRLRQRARRSGETSQMGVRSREAARQSRLKEVLLIP